MMDYSDTPYRELKQICAKRGLGGAGKRLELVMKLKDADADALARKKPAQFVQQSIVTEEPEPVVIEIQPQLDPDPIKPTFANWDENGRWVRRSKDFISWAFEERKWEQEHGRNSD
jgi:hypothetical protein